MFIYILMHVFIEHVTFQRSVIRYCVNFIVLDILDTFRIVINVLNRYGFHVIECAPEKRVFAIT